MADDYVRRTAITRLSVDGESKTPFFEVFYWSQVLQVDEMMDSNHVVTAEDVADATGQSIETVARGWHKLAEEQVDTEDPESESTDRRRMFSDD